MPHHIRQQTFQYDALGNITSCTTQFVEGDQNTATYTYERSSGKDPCQLQSVAHTHADYPKQITLTYDACGRLQADEHSRTLGYDACGRLANIAAGTSLPAASYQYDAFDRLVAQTIGADTASLYYRANALVNQLTGTNTSQHQRFIGGGIAQSTNEASPKTWLTGSDSQRNVLLTEQGETRETQTYSPYGYREPDAKAHSKLGYTGERRDPASGVYHLGNGYRSYNPMLMRFTAPDSWSPFGAGGINPYAYCAGDPINRADPSGHLSWQAWVGIAAGVVGLAAAAFTAGTSIAAADAVALAIGVVADVTAIASGVTEETNPKASAEWGWVSMGLGIIGGGIGLTFSVTRWMRASNNVFSHVETGGNYIALGKDIRVLQSVGSHLPATSIPGPDMGEFTFIFDDTYKGERRLNLVAHGISEEGAPKTIAIFNDARNNIDYLGPEEIAIKIKRELGIDYEGYKYARVVMCHSADRIGGQLSFAERFSNYTNLPTKGYEGPVFIEDHLFKIANLAGANNKFRLVPFNFFEQNAVLAEWKKIFSNKELFSISKNKRSVQFNY